MRILVTGGAGFIGGALVRKLLKDTEHSVINLDKLSYASDLTSIEELIKKDCIKDRYTFKKVNLFNSELTFKAIEESDPDLIMHLAAESHVDRSIDSPKLFIESNIIATFNLLEASRNHYKNLSSSRQKQFRFHHISTDEVFGSLGLKGRFSEGTPYDPRSPYSSSKASSDHLVKAWHHTYKLPIVLTNCSNNYGPWQFPEKLIPVVILKALANEPIPIYGDGSNIRDWLYVDDHVDGLIKVVMEGNIGESYCIGGNNEATNLEIVKLICEIIDSNSADENSKKDLITFVKDRPGHDKRYAIDSKKIKNELDWEPKYGLKNGLKTTVEWYLNNINWCKKVSGNKFYSDERLKNL